VNRLSLFARCQQFAARVYGPVFLEGFAWWSHTDGNYYGHNAILRVDAFLKHCRLPILSGSGAMGGEILSHDFVEAALMRRAGYKVRVAQDMQGSYEECPPTLIDFAQRDQRWCQGNMQHLRLIFAGDIHPMSRLHLGMGAMSYLTSPLWMVSILWSCLAFVGCGSWLGFGPATVADAAMVSAPVEQSTAWMWGGGLFAATMALLLLPKLWGYLALVADPTSRAACGGAAKAGCSVLIETVISTLVAPIMMVFHSTFVTCTFMGRKVSWSAQQRDEQGLRFAAALAAHWKQMVGGLVAAVLTFVLAPAIFLWMLPILIGLILAVPLSMLLSSVRVGQALASRRLLSTPDETVVPRVLQRHRHLLALPTPRELADPRGMFFRVLADPAFLALHRSILQSTGDCQSAEPEKLRLAERQLLAGGPARVSVENRKAVLADADALRDLHFFAWTSTRTNSSE
jgi:membrane glycosyltransferase